MKRITDTRSMQNWLAAAVTVAGVRATARHVGLPASTLAQHVASPRQFTLEEIARLAPHFGARLVFEAPDDRHDADRRAHPFYTRPAGESHR